MRTNPAHRAEYCHCHDRSRGERLRILGLLYRNGGSHSGRASGDFERKQGFGICRTGACHEILFEQRVAGCAGRCHSNVSDPSLSLEVVSLAC